jgi:N-sulfoglucosamine sulfohydrolase
MNNRFASYLIAAIFALTCALPVSSSATERPNILLIVSEDNGQELGCYGEPYVQTPVLDKLTEEGVRFHNAYVPQAGCSQSRAALLTGLYPHQNGQIGLATWKFRMHDEKTPNLVRSLKGAGYRTGIIGKLHINPESAFPFDFKAIPSANFARKNLNQYAAEAQEFFEVSDKPFFLSVNFPDAHRPFLTQVNGLPENPLTAKDVKAIAYFGLDTAELRKQTADYYNCMSRLDSQVGELLAALRASGKDKETLVVYMGDHGADMLRGKRTSYEGGVRVPLIVSWAGKVKQGKVSDALVSTLDLMPTFLDVAQAEPVDGLAGRTLLPLLKGQAGDWREYLFTEYHTHSAHNYYPQRTVRDERFKLIRNLMPGEVNPGYEYTLGKFFRELHEVVSEAPEPIRSAYERMQRPPEYELYDLQTDPHEFRNLANDAQHAATLSELKTQLAHWRTRTNDPLLNPDNLTRLKAEIDACVVDGEAVKGRLILTYPDYFFTPAPNATTKPNTE